MRDRRAALRHWLADASGGPRRALRDPGTAVELAEVAAGTSLEAPGADLAGRSVLVDTRDQLAAALAFLDLDGLAGRIVVAPPDLGPEDRAVVLRDAAVETIVTDREPGELRGLGVDIVGCRRPLARPAAVAAGEHPTEWVMLTSGTTGVPKMVAHAREAITGAIATGPAPASPPVWATFYDIRRYGGLQIFFRAILGGGSLVLSQAGEPVAAHLLRLAEAGVTHISGTPSHWRRALMSPEARAIAPGYVRLSGEIADQGLLDALRRTYPQASLGHAYASTEAGVGFEVTDGLEGFPARFVDEARPGLAMKVEEGSLRIRSNRTASRYLGADRPALVDPQGYVDTDDMVERRGDRYHFVGRRSGIINVGGLKVHPEEVEAVINRHAGVRMSLVKARANPITGAIVVADVVLREEPGPEAGAREAAAKAEILALCRAALPYHKVPVLLRFLPKLEVTSAGKLARPHA